MDNQEKYDILMATDMLDVCLDLIRNDNLDYEKWKAMHDIIKGYVIDIPNLDPGYCTLHTDKLISDLYAIFEIINARRPK